MAYSTYTYNYIFVKRTFAIRFAICQWELSTPTDISIHPLFQLPDPFLQNLDPVINLVNLQLNSLVFIVIIFCKNIQIIQFRTQLIFQVLLAVQFFSGSFQIRFTGIQW